MSKNLVGEFLESGDVADQCRELGISVGDTIEGREECGDYWHEARLTLLWLGDTEAAWRLVERSNDTPTWSEPRESVNWTLECRTWRKLTAPLVPNQPDNPATARATA